RAPEEAEREPGWLWMRTYVIGMFVALLLASAVSLVTIQGWHVLLALPAATLPVAFWIAARWPVERRRWVRRALVLFLVLRVPEIVVIGLGHETCSPPTGEGVPERLRVLFPQFRP